MTSKTSKPKKPINHQPLVSPSLTSVFSSFTQSSTGSSGSGSTVTQESLGKTRHRVHRKSDRRFHSQTKRPSRRDTGHGSLTRSGKLDVFAFMEEEAEADEEDGHGDGATRHKVVADVHDISKQGIDKVPEALPAAPMSPVSASNPFVLDDIPHIPSTRTFSIASLHSDSGISVRGVSPQRQSNPRHKKSSSRDFVPKNIALARTTSTSSASSMSSRPSISEQLDRPEIFYEASPAMRPPITKQSQQLELKPSRTTAGVSEKQGYGLLASQLCTTGDDSTQPIYRRFESLNNRILLIMQDEIVTMEKDLEIIDRQIAELESPLASPASRRAELRGPTPLQWQRMQLCGMLIPKLSQYNRTLASYQNVAQMSQTSEHQIKMYKELLEKHNPLVSSETNFLEEISDLVTVSAVSEPRRSDGKISYELGAALFFLLLAFKLIPSFLGRIVLGLCLVATLSWCGRLPVDDDAIGGVIGRRTGMYGTAVFILSLVVG